LPKAREAALGYYNREGLTVEVDTSLQSERGVRALERVFEWRGKPAAIRCDNGPEYIRLTGLISNKSHCYIFSQASLTKMRILSDLIEQPDMNG
jgi:6-phosphofructokinase